MNSNFGGTSRPRRLLKAALRPAAAAMKRPMRGQAAAAVSFSATVGGSTEAIRPARKSFVSLHRWTWTLHQAAH